MSKLDTGHISHQTNTISSMGSNFSTQQQPQPQPQTLEQAGQRKAQIQEENRKKEAEQKQQLEREQTEWLQSPQAQQLKAELLRMIANCETEFSPLADKLSYNVYCNSICRLMNTDTYTVNITHECRPGYRAEQFKFVGKITVVPRPQP